MWRRVPGILRQGPATEPAPPLDPARVRALAAQLDTVARARLGRSLAIRHVDAGSCNGCELEIHATENVIYDLERFGLRFVPSPRHADILLVTGPLTRNLREALERTWDAMPEPKWVVAVGDCAVDGGVFRGSYAVADGAGTAVPVALSVRGCPPDPGRIIEGLRALVEANARS